MSPNGQVTSFSYIIQRLRLKISWSMWLLLDGSFGSPETTYCSITTPLTLLLLSTEYPSSRGITIVSTQHLFCRISLQPLMSRR